MQHVHRMLQFALSASLFASSAPAAFAAPEAKAEAKAEAEAEAKAPASYPATQLPLASDIADVKNTPLLTLPEALALAADANPTLRGAKALVDAADGAALQAGMRPNPELSLMQEGFSGPERTSTALITQRIELAGKRGYRMEAAAYASEAALASLDARSAALRADVTAAFYGLLFSQAEVSLTDELTGIAARLAAVAARRVAAGKISPVEATRAGIAAAQAQIDAQTAHANLAAARERLASAVGNPALRERVAAGELERLPDDGRVDTLAALRERIDGSPLMRRADAERRRAEANVDLQRARRIPDITVSAGMKRLVAGGVPRNQAVIGVTIPLPLFDTNRGALLEATHDATAAEAGRDAEAARLRTRVADAYARLGSASQQARRLEQDVLPAARRAFDAMSRGFDLGKFSFLDVLDAQRTWFAARSQYLRALTDTHLAYAELGRYIDSAVPAASAATSQNTSNALRASSPQTRPQTTQPLRQQPAQQLMQQPPQTPTPTPQATSKAPSPQP